MELERRLERIMGLKITKLLVAVIVTAFFVLSFSSASAQTATSAYGAWQFQITPNVWFPGISGYVSAQGAITYRNLSLPDLFDTYDYGGGIYFEGRKDKWAFFIEPNFYNLSTESKAGGFTANIDLDEWIVEFGGAYQFADLPIESNQGVMFDILLGGRYWSVENDIDISGFPRRVDSKGWVDPFVGLRVRMNFTENLYLMARGDIGGFGLGSHFSWQYIFELGYRFTPNLSLMIGYRFLDVNYDHGTGDNYFEYDVTMQGPMVGLSFTF
jgi:hypothetical protein